MELNASKDLVINLFSQDHNAVNDHVNGLTMLCDFFTDLQTGSEGLGLTEDDARTIGMANSDLALKYVSIKVHEPQSNLVSKCLDVVDAVLAFLRNIECQLTDPEAMCFIPTLVYKVRKYLTIGDQNLLSLVWRRPGARPRAGAANLSNLTQGVRI
jgi:cytoskeleton-associated protein 5